jgi:ABC-type lipoprotein release transport system permease subunit
MSTLTSVMIGLFIGLIGSVIGIIIGLTLRKTAEYVGVMKVIREDDRVLYSLELKEDPTILESMNEVIFKVESSDESSDRK